jgi:hypothetical protein
VFGTQHRADPTSAQGKDLTVAYNDAAGRTLCPVSIAGNLGGLTLAPGVYKSTSSLEISPGDLNARRQGQRQRCLHLPDGEHAGYDGGTPGHSQGRRNRFERVLAGRQLA